MLVNEQLKCFKFRRTPQIIIEFLFFYFFLILLLCYTINIYAMKRFYDVYPNSMHDLECEYTVSKQTFSYSIQANIPNLSTDLHNYSSLTTLVQCNIALENH